MPLTFDGTRKDGIFLLPLRTTLDDIDAVCGYLVTKPTGATLAEAKAVVDTKRLDGRKLAALKVWGLIEEDGAKLKITERGRRAVRDSGSARSDVLREVVLESPPYSALVERAIHRRESTITATEAAAHWHEHFKDEASGSDKSLNDQAVCFFHVAQGADLGVLTMGRKGQQTRFDYDLDSARRVMSMSGDGTTGDLAGNTATPIDEDGLASDREDSRATTADSTSNNVFITHGKNEKILAQIKELVAYGKFEPVVAVEHETPAQPVSQKVMGDMRRCRAAVIHVDADTEVYDKDGEAVRTINDNVLIEIGAAMALYGEKFILLVEEGIELPSNLQGLYECRYEGDELNMSAIMKLLKALSEF